MNLREFFLSLEIAERESFVKRAGTTLKYMPLLTGGHRRASPGLARRLCAASDGNVTLAELRPDIWTPDEAA